MAQVGLNKTVPTMRWSIGPKWFNDYTFSGPWISQAQQMIPLYLMRGHTYVFVNNTGSYHPFEIRVSNGGPEYTSGISGSKNGTQLFIVM